MKTREEKIQCLFNYFDKKNTDITFGKLSKYEQYDNEDIICANWNDLPNSLSDWIEKELEIEIGWIDEYTYCNICGQIIRYSPNSYDWQMQGILDRNGYVCRECIEDDIDILIDGFKNNLLRAIPDWSIALVEKEGFECIDNDSCNIFESGFFEGQNDNPKKIIESIKKELGEDYLETIDYLFCMNEVSQFYCKFSLMFRKKIDN